VFLTANLGKISEPSAMQKAKKQDYVPFIPHFLSPPLRTTSPYPRSQTPFAKNETPKEFRKTAIQEILSAV